MNLFVFDKYFLVRAFELSDVTVFCFVMSWLLLVWLLFVLLLLVWLLTVICLALTCLQAYMLTQAQLHAVSRRTWVLNKCK